MRSMRFFDSIFKRRLGFGLFLLLLLIAGPVFTARADEDTSEGIMIEVGPVISINESDTTPNDVAQQNKESDVRSSNKAILNDEDDDNEETLVVQNRLILAGSNACVGAQTLQLATQDVIEDEVAEIPLQKQERLIVIIELSEGAPLEQVLEQINAVECDDLVASPDYLTIGEGLISVGSGGIPVAGAPETSLAEQWPTEFIGELPNKPNGNNTKVFVFDTFCDQELPDSMAITSNGNVNLCGHGHAVQDVIEFMAPKAEVQPVRVLDDHLMTSMGTLIIEINKQMSAELAEKDNLKRTVWNFSLSVNGRAREVKPLKYMLKEIHKNKGVVVAAAGNKDQDEANFPARYNFVIDAGAIGTDGNPTSYSNAASVYAPGGNGDCEVDPDGCLILSDPNSDTGYSYYAGSSFAAPFASGTVALIQHAGLRQPNAIRELIYNAAVITNNVINIPTTLSIIPE